MPIKIPKGFQRRKSSGNVLDEKQTSEPSFKVFPRPNSEHKSLDMNLNRQKPLPPRRNSFEEEDEDLFTVMRPDAANRYVSPSRTAGNGPDSDSGSGGTSNSLSTAQYDSAASSTRLSSSSTNPSSVDARSDKNIHSASQVPLAEPPPPPYHQSKSSAFLRNAGRTFSFGVKSKPPETVEPSMPPIPATKSQSSYSQGRERAMTASTVNTTTPPRLLESDLSLDTSGLGSFGNMFDGIGSKSQDSSPIRRVLPEISATPSGNQLRPDAAHASRLVSSPTSHDRPAQIESSPYSWTSDNSRDGLMHTPSSTNTVVHNSVQGASGRAFGKPMRETTSLQHVEASADDNMFADTPSRAQAYSRPSRPNAPPPSAFPSSSRPTTSSNSNRTTTGTSLQTSPILETEPAMFDPSLLASAELATRYQEIKPVPSTPSGKKVMTPAQFERYKQQEEERHRMNKVFQNKKPDSDDSDDNYDDADEDDETERDRQVAKQRRKQEAHLAVYRQTMMKVTGEVPTPAANASGNFNGQPPASQSTTDLANQFSAISFDKSPARSSDDDEDDDVPLGILAAHGFPNKNRPPNRLSTSTSNPNLRSVMQHQQGPASVAGESMKRGSLPVFARHLPEDPYYGASLVNQSNRESMAMNTPQYVPSGASTAHPHHPAGLVGVIAGEERARAMRRGSPNAATGGYDVPAMQAHPGMPRAQTTGSMPNLMVPGMQMMPGMPGMPMMPGMPPMPQMLSPGDHAQLQMSQQMTQMMQMQMQWMQQMQQFMTNQGPSANGPPQISQTGPMPSNIQAGATMSRPQSVPLQGAHGQDQRTMSLLSPPNVANWNGPPSSFRPGPGSTYTPSIAPSERSNVGLASRYRPVSTIQESEQPWKKRASTMTSTTFRPWSSHMTSSSKQPVGTVRKVAPSADDEDDEQGWAEMKAKKEQKKKTWKLRKGQNVLQELYN